MPLLVNMDINNSLSLVLDTLTRAASQNTEVLKPAEEQLKSWESESGFYSALLLIFSNRQLELNVRWQAVIYFKNGVDRYWRKNAPNAISEEEKSSLRKQLIASFDEPVNQIATQLAVLISKVARYDCPREWPELVPTLLEAVQSSEELIQHRALLTLQHVTESLASKRLAGDRRIFQELTNTIFRFVLNVWDAHTKGFLSGESDCMSKLEKAILSLKVLRKLIVHGFKEPHRVEDAVLFLNSTFPTLRTMLQCRVQITGNDLLKEKCEKFIILLTKVLRDVLENHPFSYIQFIKLSLEFSVAYLFTNEGSGLIFEKFVIQCLKLIKSIIMCAEYRPPKAAEVTKEPATVEAHEIKLQFFTKETLTEICRQLVSHYFLLTETELSSWESDPEGFATVEVGETWKFSLKPCTEVVFLSLFHEFKQILIPTLIDLISRNVGPCDPNDALAVLSKEAVYNAVGLVAYDLFDEVNFDEWFTGILRKELEVPHPSYKIIRRRVIWLIGQWVSVKFASDLRPLLYEVILKLLSPEEDLVVRLTAAATLKTAIDDFDFNVEQFLPYLQHAINLLFGLLRQVHEGDTKMNVLHVLSFIVERVGPAVQPHIDDLIQYLPHLWNESEDHNMLRCAIISNLVQAVKYMGRDSEKLYPFLIPVIKLSTDVHQPPHVYLLEDGLELWLVTVENASALHAPLLDLCPNLLDLIEISSENLTTTLHVIQAYVLLSPNEFLQKYANAIVTATCSMITELRSEGVVMLLKLVETVLKSLPQEGPQIFKPLLPHVFRTISNGKAYPMVITMYLSVFCRVLMNSQNTFDSVLQGLAKEDGKSPEVELGTMLDVWLDKMALVNPVERRKLLGLALASILTWNSFIIKDRFCGILLAIVEVLNDIIKTDNIGAQLDSLVLNDNETENHGDYDSEADDEEETEHTRRKKQLSLKDPVHAVILKDYLHSQLLKVRQMKGDLEFEQLLQTVDIETMQQLRDYLNIA